MQLFSFPRLETLSLRGLRIAELVAVARIFKLLIYPGDFVARENGEFIAEGLPITYFAPFLTELSVARLQQAVEVVETLSGSLQNWMWIHP